MTKYKTRTSTSGRQHLYYISSLANSTTSNHLFFLMQNHRLYLAPLDKNIKNALDIGTGTGIWAIDFADEFPDCSVLGTDISPIQPNMVPPNCGFIIDDCEAGDWDYGPEFDYIHIRTMFGCIKDWPALYAKAYRSVVSKYRSTGNPYVDVPVDI